MAHMIMRTSSVSLPIIVLAVAAVAGCSADDGAAGSESETAESGATGSGTTGSGTTGSGTTGSGTTGSGTTDTGVTDTGATEPARILSVYYGLDALPVNANLACGAPVAGQDGVPVTFSVQLEGATIAPEDFAVETATGDLVTPNCATLAPATEPLELRTVLLTGTFGTPDAQIRAVEVVGELTDVDGQTVTGLRSDEVTPLEDGPSIVLAERYLSSNPGIAGECPIEATQVVQLVWGGGVTGPAGAPLGEEQRLGVSVRLDDGSTVSPVALADDDPDNFVYACLDATSPAVEISVAAGLFHDPGDDANPATSATVIDRVP